MRRWLRSVRAFAARYWYDGVSWTMASVIALAGSLAAMETGDLRFTVGGALGGGFVGLVMRVSRQELDRGRRRLGEREAARRVAELATAHLMEHTVWRDHEAERVNRERLIARLVEVRQGGPSDRPDLLPVRRQWTAQSILEAGEASLDPRAIPDDEWIDVRRGFREAREAFAARVGPFTASLTERSRELVRRALEGLEGAGEASSAIAMQLAKEDERGVQASVHRLYEELSFSYAAIIRLERDAAGD